MHEVPIFAHARFSTGEPAGRQAWGSALVTRRRVGSFGTVRLVALSIRSFPSTVNGQKTSEVGSTSEVSSHLPESALAAARLLRNLQVLRDPIVHHCQHYILHLRRLLLRAHGRFLGLIGFIERFDRGRVGGRLHALVSPTPVEVSSKPIL